MENQGYDMELERAIADLGRERVFAVARANGWSAWESPPKWVWWNIVAELRGRDALAT